MSKKTVKSTTTRRLRSSSASKAATKPRATAGKRPRASRSIFDNAEGRSLPASVLEHANKLYQLVKDKPWKSGTADLVAGFAVETHTLGYSVNTARDNRSEAWVDFLELWNKYEDDRRSLCFGDPDDGVFVTVTPKR